jgi:hypothetical protein
VAPLQLGPRILLLHDQTLGVEAKQGRAGERLQRAVLGSDYRPPVDRGSQSVHDGLPEPALGGVLVSEGPRCVCGWSLPFAKRVRVEDGVLRIQRGDAVDVRQRPRTSPDGRPASRGVPRVYFATSMARLSRITITFTWPGYSSWSSISRAISCERSTAASSSISEGSTITLISRPA